MTHSLARITLDVYAVLPEDRTARNLSNDEVRTILAAALRQSQGTSVFLPSDAGSFAGKEGWIGLYTIDVSQVDANLLMPADVPLTFRLVPKAEVQA